MVLLPGSFKYKEYDVYDSKTFIHIMLNYKRGSLKVNNLSAFHPEHVPPSHGATLRPECDSNTKVA